MPRNDYDDGRITEDELAAMREPFTPRVYPDLVRGMARDRIAADSAKALDVVKGAFGARAV